MTMVLLSVRWGPERRDLRDVHRYTPTCRGPVRSRALPWKLRGACKDEGGILKRPSPSSEKFSAPFSTVFIVVCVTTLRKWSADSRRPSKRRAARGRPPRAGAAAARRADGAAWHADGAAWHADAAAWHAVQQPGMPCSRHADPGCRGDGRWHDGRARRGCDHGRACAATHSSASRLATLSPVGPTGIIVRDQDSGVDVLLSPSPRCACAGGGSILYSGELELAPEVDSPDEESVRETVFRRLRA